MSDATVIRPVAPVAPEPMGEPATAPKRRLRSAGGFQKSAAAKNGGGRFNLLAMSRRLLATVSVQFKTLPSQIKQISSRLAWIRIIRPAGWVALGVAVLSGAVGLFFLWIELLLIALGVGVILAVAVIFVVGKQRFAVSLDVARLRVKVGASVFGKVEISNPTTRRQLPVEIQLPVGNSQLVLRVPRLASQESWEDSFQIPTKRRAVIPLGPVRSVRGDPFGLLSRQVQWTKAQELFVHPDTVVIAGTAAGFVADLEGKPTAELSASDVSFHALRDYVVGDDLRHIHWKTVARTRKLMVRQFEQTRRSHLVVALGMHPEEYICEEAFELAAAAAASLGVQALREDHDLSVYAQGRELHRETPVRLLDDFSRLLFGEAQPSIATVARDAAALVPDASMAVIVTGSVPTPADIYRAAMPFGADTRVFVVRCEPGISVSRRTISEAPVISLGQLSDLPRALRMVAA